MPVPQYSERKAPGLWIVGLGTQFPENLLRPEELELFARKHYDVKSAGHVFLNSCGLRATTYHGCSVCGNSSRSIARQVSKPVAQS